MRSLRCSSPLCFPTRRLQPHCVSTSLKGHTQPLSVFLRKHEIVPNRKAYVKGSTTEVVRAHAIGTDKSHQLEGFLLLFNGENRTREIHTSACASGLFWTAVPNIQRVCRRTSSGCEGDSNDNSEGYIFSGVRSYVKSVRSMDIIGRG